MSPRKRSVRRLASPEILKEFGNHLRWLREAYEEVEPLHHSQGQWASLFGVTQSQLSRWESGIQPPDLDILLEIDLTTQATLDYLFYGAVSKRMPGDVRAVLLARHPALMNEAAFRSHTKKHGRRKLFSQIAGRKRRVRPRPVPPDDDDDE